MQYVHDIGEEVKMVKYRRTVGEGKFPVGPGCCCTKKGQWEEELPGEKDAEPPIPRTALFACSLNLLALPL